MRRATATDTVLQLEWLLDEHIVLMEGKFEL